MIPAGLTYAQLSILINEIVGWKERPAYVFEFYQRGLRLQEEDGVRPFIANWKYSMLEASLTYIDECFEQEEWFSYHLENGYSHRVTIEGVCDIDGLSFPLIEKYKGDCPGEASGSFDVSRVNDILKEKYCVSYEEKEDFRRQGELYAEIDNGGRGLTGKVNPQNDPERIRKSSSCILGELVDQLDFLRDKLREACAERELEQSLELSDTMLKEALGEYSIEELKDKAVELNLYHYASLSRMQLQEKIANELLRPPVMRSRMCMLTDMQMEVFERILNEGKLYRFSEEEESAVDALYELDYIIEYNDGLAEVPPDVRVAYERINTPEFQEERRKMMWLGSCLLTGCFLYITFPVSVLRRMYRRKPGYKASDQELIKLFNRIPENARLCTLEDGQFMDCNPIARDNYQKVKQQQADVEYYIPSLEEIESYEEHRYFSSIPAYQEIKNFLERMDQRDFIMEEVLRTINQWLSREWSPEGIVENICAKFLELSNHEVRRLTELVRNAAMHTRRLIHRGHTDYEMAQCRPVQPDNVLSKVPVQAPTGMQWWSGNGTAAASVKKPYPNDPCPCGSGKKYKKCCGK